MHRPAAPPRPWSVVVAGAALIAVWAAVIAFRVLHLQPGSVDARWDAMTAATDAPALHAVATALAVIGTGVPAAAVAVAAALWMLAARGRPAGLLVIVASLASELQVSVMKVVAMRTRPDSAFGVGTAFPSGHTANAALLATVLVLLVRHLAVRVPAVLYVVAMAWSRTALHAHWLTDVVAGAAAGAATAVLLHAAFRALTDARDAPRPSAGAGILAGTTKEPTP